ncbi:MAG: FmdB family zinc ribbon protein [Planctomycetota bacterium]|jgi:DNA-directed RNA polymerase subunit RPC12/RpoP
MSQKGDGYVRFRCRACGQRLKVRDTMEGGDVIPCPKCGASVNVPLANLEAIAKQADMEETGQPGRLNVDPELLMKRLRGEGEEASERGRRGHDGTAPADLPRSGAG